MRIRKATASDHAELITFAFPVGDEGREQHLLSDINKGACHLAEDRGAVLGFIVLDRSFFGHSFVRLLLVHPDHRRQGVGRALMQHVESICCTEKLFVSTNRSNIPMQELCDSLGYVPSGVVENLDEGDPELFFFKKLKT